MVTLTSEISRRPEHTDEKEPSMSDVGGSTSFATRLEECLVTRSLMGSQMELTEASLQNRGVSRATNTFGSSSTRTSDLHSAGEWVVKEDTVQAAEASEIRSAAENSVPKERFTTVVKGRQVSNRTAHDVVPIIMAGRTSGGKPVPHRLHLEGVTSASIGGVKEREIFQTKQPGNHEGPRSVEAEALSTLAQIPDEAASAERASLLATSVGAASGSSGLIAKALGGTDEGSDGNGRSGVKADQVATRAVGSGKLIADPGGKHIPKPSDETVIAGRPVVAGQAGAIGTTAVGRDSGQADVLVTKVETPGVTGVVARAHVAVRPERPDVTAAGPTNTSVAAEAERAGPLTAGSSVRSGYERGDSANQGIIVTSPHSLEVGVANGSHGWLKIRAEVDGNVVTASLSARSNAGQEMLHRELPALASYLQEERVAVHSVVVEKSAGGSSLPGEASSDSGDGAGARDSGLSDRRHGETEVEPWGDGEEASSYSGTDSVGLQLGVYGNIGGWLNVRV